jgi:tripartite-type tricarboxylate transporter receptor subunit TctC
VKLPFVVATKSIRPLLLGAALVLALQPAKADQWTDKPIRVVVPIAPGSSLDTRARLIALSLERHLKQRIIVENKPGAGGTLGAAYAARAPADGSVLLFTNDSVVINPHVYRQPGYDALKDFSPVMQAYISALVLVAAPNAGTRTVQQLITFARQKGGHATYASSGNGGLPHLAMETFKRYANIQLTHIPYKGDAPALSDVIAGRVSFMMSGVPAAIPQVRAGRVYALGVTTTKRIIALPDVPTVAEAGVAGYEFLAWAGFFAPARTPPHIVEAMNRALTVSLNSEAVQAHFVETGARATRGTPAQFSAFLAAEHKRYGSLTRELGLQAR